ncbi:hypothetical protein FBZ83_101276 [Azospirillum brasilense]|uniref:Uncharacterized protein n=1 Tax=Azospirillum brasilense TaxID=192 RepID=A0A560CRC8_AZOBR|nr:hypothetical protein FBZ83_101276 [Azospirillum brasilense]
MNKAQYRQRRIKKAGSEPSAAPDFTNRIDPEGC